MVTGYLMAALMVTSPAVNEQRKNADPNPEEQEKQVYSWSEQSAVTEKKKENSGQERTVEVIGLTNPEDIASERRILENQRASVNSPRRSGNTRRNRSRVQTPSGTVNTSPVNYSSKRTAPNTRRKRATQTPVRNSISGEIPSNYLTAQERIEYNQLYRKFKNHPDLKNSQTALKRALAFYVKHEAGSVTCSPKLNTKRIQNKNYLLITDYTIPHPSNRFFILSLHSGQVTSSPAAHGYGSNRNCPRKYQIRCGSRGMKCRIPVRMSNILDTGATSRGFYITDELYRSTQATFTGGSIPSRGANAIRLSGLQYGINDQARNRAVVLHRASYYKNICSSSAGCPAIKPRLFETYKNHLGGALLYIHTIEDENAKLPNCVGVPV